MKYSNTITNKWHKEIKYLVKKVKYNTQLTRDQVVNATSDSLINFIKMIDKHQIDPSNYDNYKGMMFIITRSMVNRQFQNANNKENIKFKYAIELTENMISYEMNNDKLDLSNLSPIDRAIFRWYRRKWTQVYIAKVLGIGEGIINRKIMGIKRKLIE